MAWPRYIFREWSKNFRG